MKKKTVGKKKSFLNTPGLVSAMLGVIGISVGAIALTNQFGDYNVSFDTSSQAQYATSLAEFSGEVWRENPVNPHTISLSGPSTMLVGVIKEGHPELGCTNGPDRGVNPNCDQGQPTESFDLVCDGQTIFEYRDRGPEIEEYITLEQPINLAAGQHSCEVRHAENGPRPRDGGSVNYHFFFKPADYQAVCRTIDFTTIPGVAPADMKEGLVVTDQYVQEYGVRFSNGNLAGSDKPCQSNTPLLAKYGGPQFAYYPPDQLAMPRKEKANFEPFFLTGRNVGPVGTRFPDRNKSCGLVLDIQPSRRVTSVSFDIMDVDGGEVWAIQALGQDGSVLDEQTVDKKTRRALNIKPYAGGSRPTPVKLSGNGQVISKVEMYGTVTKRDGWGYGFDNFEMCQ